MQRRPHETKGQNKKQLIDMLSRDMQTFIVLSYLNLEARLSHWALCEHIQEASALPPEVNLCFELDARQNLRTLGDTSHYAGNEYSPELRLQPVTAGPRKVATGLKMVCELSS